jgi:hypothetical protein
MHRRSHNALISQQSCLNGGGMKTVKDGFHRRVACHFHFETHTFRSEAPRLVEMVFPHKPVHNGFDDRFAIDATLPRESLGGYQSRLDDADR